MVISQGYRKANYGLDMGVRKNFFDKKLTLSVNCRDVLDSRKWQRHTLQTVSSPDNAIKHEPACCKCCGRPLDGVGHRKM